MRRGTPLVLLGPTGAGKTALVRVLTGGIGDFEIEGSAELEGQPISSTRCADLVLRRPALLQRSIAEVVNPDAQDGAVERALEALELHDFLHPLMRPMLDLTPFEIRLALLVRKAIRRPSVAAFDEPTYGLSAEEIEIYCRTLRALSKQIGVVVATRNAAIADAIAGDLLVFDRGNLTRRAFSADVPDGEVRKTRKKTFQTCDSYVPPSDGHPGVGVVAIPPMARLPRDSGPEGDGLRETSAFPAFVVAPDRTPEK
jgi:ABC-type multidrug transport system ATPase subunit